MLLPFVSRVVVSPSALLNLHPVEIPGRDPILSPLYEYRSPDNSRHPQRRSNQGRVYVHIVDSSPEGKAFDRAYVDQLEVPSGRNDEISDGMSL